MVYSIRISRAWLLAAPVLTLFLQTLAPAQEHPPAARARQVSGLNVSPDQVIRTRSAGVDSSRIELITGTDSVSTRSLLVPFPHVTDVAWVNDEFLFACRDASGMGSILRVLATRQELVLLDTVSLAGPAAESLAARDGLLAVLTTDGTVVVLSWQAGTPIPPSATWGPGFQDDFTRNAARLRGQVFFWPDGDLGIAGSSRAKRRYVQQGGRWLAEEQPAGRRPFVVVETPVRLASGLRVRASANGPLVLESARFGVLGTVGENSAPGQWLELPTFAHALSQADRYRLRSADAISGWFRPQRLIGASWAISGGTMREIAAATESARVERGALVFRAQFDVPAAALSTRLVTVALVEHSATPTPTTVERGGRIWLEPGNALWLEQGIQTSRHSYSLAAPVALPRTMATVGSWLHAQLVALDEAGQVLGATGVLSVQVLPDAGGIAPEHEARVRAQTGALWAQHGIPNLTAFWNVIVLR